VIRVHTSKTDFRTFAWTEGDTFEQLAVRLCKKVPDSEPREFYYQTRMFANVAHSTWPACVCVCVCVCVCGNADQCNNQPISFGYLPCHSIELNLVGSTHHVWQSNGIYLVLYLGISMLMVARCALDTLQVGRLTNVLLAYTPPCC
jgi:hypothetical protein